MHTNKKLDQLALKAFSKAVSTNDSNTSLQNLLTTKEQIQVGRRILIAQAIMAGKTRFEINNHLSVSPNTYAQIRRWLESEFTEYSSAHKSDTTAKYKTKEKVELLSYAPLKQKYPAHFLLFPLVEELFKIKK